MKRWIALLLAAALAFSAAAAAAEYWDDETDWDGEEAWGDEEDEAADENGLDLADFSWLKKPVAEIDYRDLGSLSGSLVPVYGAPYEDAWRGAGGKAAVSTAESFRLLGWNRQEDWLLIEYDLKPGQKRIGWIHARSETQRKSYVWFPLMSRNLLKVTAGTELTDDPNGSRRAIAALSPGDTVIGICKSGDWACVETLLDGKPVWAFCRPDALERVPLWHQEGSAIVVHEGVTMLGDFFYESIDNPEGYRDYEYVPEPAGTVRVTLPLDGRRDLETVVLPKSLRWIAESAFNACALKTLTLPEGVRISTDVCYGCSFGELVIPAGVTDVYGFYNGEYTEIERFNVAEGNPAYRSVDGVLFSADGKTLIRYPNGRPDEHYDVPAGTEVIEDWAFEDDDVAIPLRSISLPMGLKKIGRGAFGGCGRLVSLTVPLTVTEIGEYAFNGCVSLEQLSLPPGVNVALEREMGSWDFGRYHGDNGKTDTRPEEPHDVYWDGILDSPEGAGTVILYADSACLVPKGELPAGTQVRVTDLRSGICRIYTNEELYAPLASVQRLTGETLFSITAGRFAPGAVPLYSDVFSEEPDVSNPDDWKLESWFELSSEVSFQRTVEVWEDGEFYTDTEYVTFAIQDTTLRRARTGDTRTLGLLVSADRSVPVQYADAPNAASTGHVWSGEQAEVLEAADGWLRVRTARGTFWVAEADFRVVEQE